jgi:hypothetical protein
LLTGTVFGHELGEWALSLDVLTIAQRLPFFAVQVSGSGVVPLRASYHDPPNDPRRTRPSAGVFSDLADALLRGIDLRFLRLGALLSRSSLAAQIESRVDQADMAVRLGKIAKHSASERIKLFGEQTHVVAPRQ